MHIPILSTPVDESPPIRQGTQGQQWSNVMRTKYREVNVRVELVERYLQFKSTERVLQFSTSFPFVRTRTKECWRYIPTKHYRHYTDLQECDCPTALPKHREYDYVSERNNSLSQFVHDHMSIYSYLNALNERNFMRRAEEQRRDARPVKYYP